MWKRGGPELCVGWVRRCLFWKWTGLDFVRSCPGAVRGLPEARTACGAWECSGGGVDTLQYVNELPEGSKSILAMKYPLCWRGAPRFVGESYSPRGPVSQVQPRRGARCVFGGETSSFDFRSSPGPPLYVRSGAWSALVRGARGGRNGKHAAGVVSPFVPPHGPVW